jgi:membrane dipeptidase
MDYMIKLVGIEHLALGMDFVKYDGPRTLKDRHHPLHKDPLIKGFEEIEDLPNLIDGLQRHGYQDKEIKLILGGNYLRVLKTILPEQSVI